MGDVIEVSYTGDLLAHRRCPRAWAYGSHAGFHPYELVQVMEGRLVHHAMEWLARFHRDSGGERHATEQQLRDQLEHYFKVLWARGIRTAFEPKQDVLDRVIGNLFPNGRMHRTVRAAVEGAEHTEYELRAVRKVLPADFAGKQKILLTGVIDLVVQQDTPLIYPALWVWNRGHRLDGTIKATPVVARSGDMEIWDYKATRAATSYLLDYARQLLTYAALFKERTGELPRRCVLFFVNERKESARLLAVEVSDRVLDAAVAWTQGQVAALQATLGTFERDPISVDGGDFTLIGKPKGERITRELRQQCTACGLRFDCEEYRASLGRRNHADVDLLNVFKN